MPTTKSTETTTAEKQFHSIGAIFATSSTTTPFVGMPDDGLLKACNLEAPEGQEWKIFLKHKISKKGKPYLSAYLGLSDIQR